MGPWIAVHGEKLLQNGAIIASFLLSFAAYMLNVSVLREEKNSRRISNLITLTEQHRGIWRDSLRREFLRVNDAKADLHVHGVTDAEENFVNSVVNHLAACFQAIRAKEVAPFGDVEADAGRFFSLPIPAAVWRKIKFAQDGDFVAFVERAIQKARGI